MRCDDLDRDHSMASNTSAGKVAPSSVLMDSSGIGDINDSDSGDRAIRHQRGSFGTSGDRDASL